MQYLETWKKIVLVFVRHTLIAVGGAALVLGLFGYFLAGWEGFVNAAIWGAVFGLVGGFTSGLIVVGQAQWWGDYAGRFGSWWLDRETKGEEQKPRD